MARAKRHYIPEQTWHLTHRCHKWDFLLKLVKDKQRWIQWLFEAKGKGKKETKRGSDQANLLRKVLQKQTAIIAEQIT